MTKQELEQKLDEATKNECMDYWHHTNYNGDENYCNHQGTYNAGILFLSNLIESELEKGNDIRIILDLLKEISQTNTFPNEDKTAN